MYESALSMVCFTSEALGRLRINMYYDTLYIVIVIIKMWPIKPSLEVSMVNWFLSNINENVGTSYRNCVIVMFTYNSSSKTTISQNS